MYFFICPMCVLYNINITNDISIHEGQFTSVRMTCTYIICLKGKNNIKLFRCNYDDGHIDLWTTIFVYSNSFFLIYISQFWCEISPDGIKLLIKVYGLYLLNRVTTWTISISRAIIQRIFERRKFVILYLFYQIYWPIRHILTGPIDCLGRQYESNKIIKFYRRGCFFGKEALLINKFLNNDEIFFWNTFATTFCFIRL